MDIHSKLTILIPTNLIPSAPSISILEKTITSIQSNSFLNRCNIIVSVDCGGYESNRFKQYVLNIKNRFPNITITISDKPSILHNFSNLFNSCTTKYCLFLEHDWVFIKDVNFNDIVDVMDSNGHINQIRFNKRDNVPIITDHTLVKDDSIQLIPLLKTSSWSNNPKIMRMSHWQYCKAILSRTTYNSDDLELALYLEYGDDIKKYGFDTASSMWGSHLYGNINDSAVVEHLDGRNS